MLELWLRSSSFGSWGPSRRTQRKYGTPPSFGHSSFFSGRAKVLLIRPHLQVHTRWPDVIIRDPGPPGIDQSRNRVMESQRIPARLNVPQVL